MPPLTVARCGAGGGGEVWIKGTFCGGVGGLPWGSGGDVCSSGGLHQAVRDDDIGEPNGGRRDLARRSSSVALGLAASGEECVGHGSGRQRT